MLQENENFINQESIFLIVYAIIVLLVLIFFFIAFFISFQKRKNLLLKEQFEVEKKFQKELNVAQSEIQEQTFKNIAWELHDNVGQLLSVASMQLNLLLVKSPEDLKESIVETKNVITNTVQEVRSLSKTLNNDVIQKNGLIRSLQIEVERFNRLNFLEASLNIEGDIVDISNEHEILIFRIYQEFLSNVMKHAKATTLNIFLKYKATELVIIAEDNGIGFDTSFRTESSGLETIKGRSSLLGAEYSLNSEIGKGTILKLVYTYPNE